uniref:Transmembrane protein 100 n=1 Tax=Anser brachyrhynchus TaxID=132585 RepID=A0A8B9BAX5_9AVES
MAPGFLRLLRCLIPFPSPSGKPIKKKKNNAGAKSAERTSGLPLATATDSTATLNKLALATGGTEKSWYRCIFPFGIVSVVVGVAATCITFTINGPQMDIAKVVSVATLIFGVGLLVAAYVCWRAKRERQRKRQRQEPVPVEQGAL